MSTASKVKVEVVETPDLELPKGWCEAALLEVATLQRGFDLPAHMRSPGSVPVYAANGQVGTHSVARINAPGVITGRSGTIGKVHFVERDFWPLNTALYVKDFHGNDPKFIAELLRHFGLEQYLAGTGVPTLNRNVVHEISVRIPPLNEQLRIAEKVKDVREQIEASKARLLNAFSILKQFRQAVLTAACSGKLTEDWRQQNPSSLARDTELVNRDPQLDQILIDFRVPQSWHLSTLGRIVLDIEAGKNIRCDEHPPGPDQKGIIKISAVTWGEFLQDESKTLTNPNQFISARRIKAGDLLISRANTIEFVGACVLVRSISRTLMLSDKVLRLQAPNDQKKWLLFCLRSPLGRAQIETLATGNQLSMRNLTQENLRQIAIPLPPALERDEIVRRIEALFKLADAIEKRVAAASARAENLTQAVLAKAFRGELVPTEAELAKREGREYEPASVLLKRIRAERAETEKPKSGHRQKSRAAQ